MPKGILLLLTSLLGISFSLRAISMEWNIGERTNQPRSFLDRRENSGNLAEPESASSQVARGTAGTGIAESSGAVDETEDETTLTLDRFRTALAHNPTAFRFVINEDEEGGVSIQSRAATTEKLTPQQDQVENETVTEALRGLLVARHGGVAEVVDSFFGEGNFITAPLSAERLNQILKKSDDILNNVQTTLPKRTPPAAASEFIALTTPPATKPFSKAAAEDDASSESETDSVEGLRLQFEASANVAESDGSPNSSDDEYGAKTLMRRVSRRVRDIPTRLYDINQHGTEEITQAEIQANPGKYYVANFRGDYLNYFSSNAERRATVKAAVGSVEAGTPLPFKSKAIQNIENKHPEDSEKTNQLFKGLNTEDKLKSPTCRFINTYKTPAKFQSAVEAVSPEYGNPFISTSKDVRASLQYADHPAKEATLHPKYSSNEEPKHRLIGLITIIVHEANEYLKRNKADIEKLRKDGLVGKLQKGFERDNQEILFDKEIDSDHVAGYLPLAYPNLSKIRKTSCSQYTLADKELFGLEEAGRKWSISTKVIPRTLGKTTKDEALYRSNRNFQWRLAEKYVTDRNPDGELLWIDNDGKFNRFRVNQNLENISAGAPRSLASEFAAADSSEALSSKITTKPELKTAAESAPPPDVTTQKIISLQQESAAYFAHHQIAQTAKKENESISWYCAWRSASEAAKNLQKVKGHSGVADQWSEIAKQQESSIPFFQQAISAFQNNESIQGNNLHEIGRSLYHSGDKLGKSIEAESRGELVEAAKLKEESLKLKRKAERQQKEEENRILALQKAKEEARIQLEKERQAATASAKAKAEALAKAEVDAKREAAIRQAQIEARIKAEADASRFRAAQAELERQQQLRREQLALEHHRQEAMLAETMRAEAARQQQIRLLQQQREAAQRQQQIELLYRQQAARAEAERREEQMRYRPAAPRQAARLRMTGNYSSSGKPYAECPTCGGEYTVNSDGTLRKHGCP